MSTNPRDVTFAKTTVARLHDIARGLYCFGTIRDYPKWFRTIRDCSILFCNYLEFFRDHLRLFRHCSVLFETIWRALMNVELYNHVCNQVAQLAQVCAVIWTSCISPVANRADGRACESGRVRDPGGWATPCQASIG